MKRRKGMFFIFAMAFLLFYIILGSMSCSAVTNGCGVCPPGCVDSGDPCADPCSKCPGECDCLRCICPDLDDEEPPCEIKTYYEDSDGDGFGNKNKAATGCQAPEGFVLDDNDCNDNNEDINPDAEEVCWDNIDNNCDGYKDESCSSICGNDKIEGSEECDDGNLVTETCSYGLTSCFVCDSNCRHVQGQTSYCGDGKIDALTQPGSFEECDDGNRISGDCCSSDCRFETGTQECGIGECKNETQMCSQYTLLQCVPKLPSSEICDVKDNDCDGMIDNGVIILYYLDYDGDGYGDIRQPGQGCSVPSGFSSTPGDCNDNDPDINPSVREICGDRIDNDCNGISDNGCACFPGDLIDCSKGGGVCQGYKVECSSSRTVPECRWDSLSYYENEEKTCDSLDNDCDGIIDEGCDKDKDGFVDSFMECRGSFLSGNKEMPCDKIDCDDNNPARFPGNPEICDNIDNDCNGEIDDIQELPFCFQLPGLSTLRLGVCSAMKAYCDPLSGTLRCSFLNYEKQDETLCDGLDNDCDGQTDENCFCETGETQQCGSNIGACKIGTQTCIEKRWGSCIGSAGPSDEICDNIDNDCNGEIDDSLIMECSSDGCPGTSLCSSGIWMPCVPDCTDVIEMSISSADIGMFAIEANLNKEDIKKTLATLNATNQTVGFLYHEGKTIISNKLETDKNLEDLSYTLYIPKCLTTYLSDIEFENKDYRIIKEDPVIAWHFINVDDKIDLSYHVKGRINKDCLAQIKGLPIANVIKEKNSGVSGPGRFILPAIIIVAISAMVLYFHQNPLSRKPLSEEEYEKEFIDKKRNILLKQIKRMNFSSKEQAREHMVRLQIPEQDIEYIMGRL